jgi:hypothetical protein
MGHSLQVNWGPLHLLGFSLHPLSGRLTTARPDIDVDTYWRLQRRIPARASVKITLYVSPVYLKSPPAFSPRGQAVGDSPTWDWLPVSSWPVSRRVQAQFIPVVPPTSPSGKIEVAIGVRDLGPARLAGQGRRVVGSLTLVRLGTMYTAG